MARHIRTTIKITDVQSRPGHTNNKGIYIEGQIIIAVKVRYGRKYSWNKAYRILQKEMDRFTLDEFKSRIYSESRIWIKEKELQAQALEKLKAETREIIYLD